jgi:hypothetical protein
MAATGSWDTSINCLRMPPDLNVSTPQAWLKPVVSPSTPLGAAFAVTNNPAVVFVPYALLQNEQFTTYPVF